MLVKRIAIEQKNLKLIQRQRYILWHVKKIAIGTDIFLQIL
ncbi:MAG: hypothetical protein ACRC2R_24785 [Xenococcaceae cyanobacterium]